MTSHFAGAAEDAELGELLNRAERALGRKSAPEGHSRKKPQSHPEETPKRTQHYERTTPTARDAPLTPIDREGVDRVLSIDVAAKQKESYVSVPGTVMRVSAGMNWLSNGVLLTKDDDTFRKVGGDALPGTFIQFNPAWSLTGISTSRFDVSLSAALGVGYFRGDVLVQRTGVQSGTATYTYQQIPIALEAGPVLSFARTVGLQLSYGIAGELLQQLGQGQLDTATKMFWGDTAGLVLRGYVSRTVEVSLAYKWQGALLKGRDNALSSRVFLAGVGFSFEG